MGTHPMAAKAIRNSKSIARRGIASPLPPANDRLLTREETSVLLACSPSQVDVLKDTGVVPHLKIRGMVRYHWPTVLHHLLERHQVNALNQPTGYNISPSLAQVLARQQETIIGLFQKLSSTAATKVPQPPAPLPSMGTPTNKTNYAKTQEK